jgi:hypothetical protein
LYCCRTSSAGAAAPQRPQVQGRTWAAQTWRGHCGARRNGPVRPHAQRTAECRQHTCSALLPRQRIGYEVVARCLCAVIKLNINMAVAYIDICDIYIWLSLAIKIMALHWSSCHTHRACTSERNWPSSWTCSCLGAPALHRGSKNNSGKWRWRMSWSAGCALWGEVYWAIRDAKKVRPKNCVLSPRFIKTWLSNIHCPLERQN